MASHVIRLLTDTECGACAGELAAGYAVITDEIEHPAFVAVCKGCTSGLPGIEAGRKTLGFLKSLKSRLGQSDASPSAAKSGQPDPRVALDVA